MRHCKLLAIVTALLAWSSIATAAVQPLTPEEQWEDASHVVVAEVRRVYSTVERIEPHSTNTRYAIELGVKTLIKGEGIEEGSTLFARTWTPDERPEAWAGHQGQEFIPAPEGKVVAYLDQRQDDAYDLLMPNGLSLAVPLQGTIEEKPATKSMESFKAGYSPYFMLHQEDGSSILLRPSPAVQGSELTAQDGKEVRLVAIKRRGKVFRPEPGEEPEAYPIGPDGEPAAIRIGDGYQVYWLAP